MKIPENIAKIKRQLLILLPGLLMLYSPLPAQTASSWDQMGREDGLSNSVVYDAMQDRYGFVWFGTGYGLDRYDGYRVESFQHSASDAFSISNNIVRTLYEDVEGRLWVGTAAGLNRLTRIVDDRSGEAREGFIRYQTNPEDLSSIPSENIWVINGDSSGNLWVGSSDGLIYVEQEVHGAAPAFRLYGQGGQDNYPGRGIVRDLLIDDVGRVFIASLGSGLIILDPKTQQFLSYTHQQNDPSSISSNFLISLAHDKQQRLWIGTYGGGLNLFDATSGTFKAYLRQPDNEHSLGENRVFDIVAGENGLWLATFGAGLNFLDFESDKITRYPHVETSRSGPVDNFVRNLMLDRGKILWATTNNGVSKLDLKPAKFLHYYHDPHQRNSIADNRVLALLKDRHGHIWVGHNSGLDRIETGKVLRFDVDHGGDRGRKGFVTALHETATGEIWFGTHGGGVYRVLSADGRFRQYLPANSPGLLHRIIRCIYEDRAGNLFIGTLNGVSKWDAETDKFSEAFPHDQLMSRTANCILGDEQGYLWVGTEKGLFHVDVASGKATAYVNQRADAATISANEIISLHMDYSGILWVGTDNGLNRLNPFSGEITRLYQRDGLPNNFISAILGDNQGRLWISTMNGFCRYDPFAASGQRFRTYSRYDGLQGIEFVSGACFKDPDSGQMLFGGINGFNSFYPQLIVDNPIVPQVALTGFYKFDRQFLKGRALLEQEVVELTHHDRYFAIEFSALDYTVPELNRYAYRLEGFDQKWVFSKDRRLASYTNLDAGEYVFRVRAANHDGVWNRSGDSIRVKILPPFWETWWFRLLFFAAIVGFLTLLYRYRISKLLEIERVRVNIASDLHDDVGSSLTKISLYSDMVGGSADEEMRRTLLKRIGELSRELIVTMSDIVWSIDARNDNTGNLVDRMRDFAGSVLSASNIDYSFETAGLDTEKQLPIEVRQNLYLIFKEAVNNVAKHSNAVVAQIRIENHGRFVMRIQDNGAGFNQSGRHDGNGMRNMQMRARKLGGQLSYRNGNGVTVELTMDKL